jgi:hypothetical protein
MAEQSTSPTSDSSSQHGSLDGAGAGDHDEPFGGFHAYQFNTLQFARLLRLRGELLEARLGHGRWATDLAAASAASS